MDTSLLRQFFGTREKVLTLVHQKLTTDSEPRRVPDGPFAHAAAGYHNAAPNVVKNLRAFGVDEEAGGHYSPRGKI